MVQANNPHIRFSNQQYKGYGVLEARANELLVQDIPPRTVLQPRATPLTSRASGWPRDPAVEVLA